MLMTVFLLSTIQILEYLSYNSALTFYKKEGILSDTESPEKAVEQQLQTIHVSIVRLRKILNVKGNN